MPSGLLPGALFWAAYQVANPTTTPADVATIRKAVEMMTEHPVGLVRMMEGEPTLNGMVDTTDRSNIWLSREGPNYQSGNIWRIAGTLMHENEHAKGNNEIQARRAQLNFHKQTLPPDASKGDRRFLDELARRFKGYEALEETGLLDRAAILQQMKK